MHDNASYTTYVRYATIKRNIICAYIISQTMQSHLAAYRSISWLVSCQLARWCGTVVHSRAASRVWAVLLINASATPAQRRHTSVTGSAAHRRRPLPESTSACQSIHGHGDNMTHNSIAKCISISWTV